MNSCRKSELTLVMAFLAVIAAVPVTQTVLELAEGGRVQFTDVFRQRPTAKSLREYERVLEEKSWFQQNLRPWVRRGSFAALRDTGEQVVPGRESWWFYRPDLRYLVQRARPEDSAGSPAIDARSAAAERAIVRFRDQLRERGIALVVVPVPGKPAVYPERVTRRAVGPPQPLASPTLRLVENLRRQGVATVDLFAVFAAARAPDPEGSIATPLYLARDTHWTPRGAQLAAQAVADQLREMRLAPEPMIEFETRSRPVARWGDLLELTRIPGLRDTLAPERVECEQVLDPAFGLLVPSPADRPGTCRHPAPGTAVLVLGDSFSRIYQYPEPKSLGESPANAPGQEGGDAGTKRLLPGSAGFISHLALALQSPVDAIVSDGGAATDVRRKLSANPEILEGKRVVIWEFVERDIALGADGWEDVPLPARLD